MGTKLILLQVISVVGLALLTVPVTSQMLGGLPPRMPPFRVAGRGRPVTFGRPPFLGSRLGRMPPGLPRPFPAGMPRAGPRTEGVPGQRIAPPGIAGAPAQAQRLRRSRMDLRQPRPMLPRALRPPPTRPGAQRGFAGQPQPRVPQIPLNNVQNQMNTINNQQVSSAEENFRIQPTTSNGEQFPIIPASSGDNSLTSANFPTQPELANQPGANVIFPSQAAEAPVFVSQRVPQPGFTQTPNGAPPQMNMMNQVPNGMRVPPFLVGQVPPRIPAGGAINTNRGLNAQQSNTMFGQDSFTRRFANVPPPRPPVDRFNAQPFQTGSGVPPPFPPNANQQTFNFQSNEVRVVTLPPRQPGPNVQFAGQALGLDTMVPSASVLDQFQNQRQMQGGPAFDTNNQLSNPQSGQDFSIQFQTLTNPGNPGQGFSSFPGDQGMAMSGSSQGFQTSLSQNVPSGVFEPPPPPPAEDSQFQIVKVGNILDTSNFTTEGGPVAIVPIDAEKDIVKHANVPKRPMMIHPIDTSLAQGENGHGSAFEPAGDIAMAFSHMTPTGEQGQGHTMSATSGMLSPLMNQDFSFFVKTDQGQLDSSTFVFPVQGSAGASTTGSTGKTDGNAPSRSPSSFSFVAPSNTLEKGPSAEDVAMIVSEEMDTGFLKVVASPLLPPPAPTVTSGRP